MSPSTRSMTANDWPRVEAIYSAGIASGNATFETHSPSWADWDAGHLTDHRLVAIVESNVGGWAALSPVSGRCVYGGVAENSVYVDPANSRQGLGRQLLLDLIASSEASGIWTIQAGVFPENEPSLHLHTTCGFRIIGTRERVGQHHGKWRDVVLLERRSTTIGT